MINLSYSTITSFYNSPIEHERGALLSQTLLRGMHIIDKLGKPKHFKPSFCHVLEFHIENNGFINHSMRVNDYPPIDEIYSWQITGVIGERYINAVVRYIFHTFEGNRSGTGCFTINGKTDCLPKFGGITLDDIWQDTDNYKRFTTGKIQSLGTFEA